MEFVNGYIETLKKWNVFTGRARRAEFWWFYLGTVIVSVVCNILSVIPVIGVLFSIVGVLWSLTIISAAVRRLHDTGKSGWWLLLELTGIGGIVLLIWWIQDSAPGDNQYGPNPKGI
ncbi:MAG: DUF805 domain-containing protein [Clostridiales bacterium]|jgi:uncharacterized membrane protein YhaH (DUF805 family)|nr:DUF805 domain-containing protein [Clostridiales bacterium]